MKPTAIAKRTVDVLIALALLFLMGYQLWGRAAHEWAGAGMLLLFLAHHILNRSWYSGLLRGRLTPMRVFQIGVDMLLLLRCWRRCTAALPCPAMCLHFSPLTEVWRRPEGCTFWAPIGALS